jgi:hypothetical protein
MDIKDEDNIQRFAEGVDYIDRATNFRYSDFATFVPKWKAELLEARSRYYEVKPRELKNPFIEDDSTQRT